MKTTSVIIALVSVSTMAEAGGVVSMVKGLFTGGKRDLELMTRAVLTARAKTIQGWQQAVQNPSSISPEMHQALAAQGFKAPAGGMHKRAPPAPAAQAVQKAIPKQQAIQHVASGKPIPKPILASMAKAGWSGPGIGKRSLELVERDLDLSERDVVELIARSFEEDFSHELFARDAEAYAEPFAYASPDPFAYADPEAFYDEEY